jgi:hypothetical protein
MRKSLVFLLSLFVFIAGIAQQDTTKQNIKGNTPNAIETFNSSLFKIKGDVLKNFPSSNFLEAVNGLFPGVFTYNLNTDNFLFVVNGYMLPDINGISLQDIDEVIFVKSAVNGAVFPLTRVGTFYITFKKINANKPFVSFNVQHNTSAQSDLDAIDSYGNGVTYRSWTANNLKGSWQQYHLSVGGNYKKLNYFLSAQQIIDDEPRQVINNAFNYGNDTTTANHGGDKRNFRLLANLQYNFSPFVSAEIFSHYSPTTFKINVSSEDAQFIIKGKDRQTQDYFSGGVALHWKPLPQFSDDVRVEYFNVDGTDRNIYHVDYKIGNYDVNSDNRRFGFENHLLIQNNMQYSTFLLNTLKLTAGFDARYFASIENDKSISINTSDNIPVGNNYSSFSSQSKFGSLSPHFRLDINESFSLYGRIVSILRSETFKNIKSSSRYEYFAGATTNLKKVLKIKDGLSALDLNINYGDFVNNNLASYWLPDKLYTDLGLGFIYPVLFNLTQPPPEFIKTKLFTTQLTAGFMSNVIRIGLDYDNLKTGEVILLTGPSGFYTVLRNKRLSSFSVIGNAKLFNNDKQSWTSNLIISFPKYKADIPNAFVASDYDVYKAQISLQNNLRLNRFYFYVSGMMAGGRSIGILQQNGTVETKKISEWAINYFTAGYEIIPKKENKVGLSVYIHARNLFSSKEADEVYRFVKTLGIGINASF